MYQVLETIVEYAVGSWVKPKGPHYKMVSTVLCSYNEIQHSEEKEQTVLHRPTWMDLINLMLRQRSMILFTQQT